MTDLDKLTSDYAELLAERNEIQETLSMLLARLRRPLPDGMGWQDPVKSAREIVEENERLTRERDDSRETFENIITEFKAAVDEGVELVYGDWPKGMCFPQSMSEFVAVIARFANELMRERDALRARLAAAEKERDRLKALADEFCFEEEHNAGNVLRDKIATALADAAEGRRLLGEASTVMDGAVQHGFRPCASQYAEDWAMVHLAIDAHLARAPVESEPSEVEKTYPCTQCEQWTRHKGLVCAVCGKSEAEFILSPKHGEEKPCDFSDFHGHPSAPATHHLPTREENDDR